jgi:hypothetical protein
MMRTEVEEDVSGFAPPECRWHAIDAETWDGAADSRTRHEVGYGATRLAAIRDLLDKLGEEEPAMRSEWP